MNLKLHYQWKLRDQTVSRTISVPNPDDWIKDFTQFMAEAKRS